MTTLQSLNQLNIMSRNHIRKSWSNAMMLIGILRWISFSSESCPAFDLQLRNQDCFVCCLCRWKSLELIILKICSGTLSISIIAQQQYVVSSSGAHHGMFFFQSYSGLLEMLCINDKLLMRCILRCCCHCIKFVKIKWYSNWRKFSHDFTKRIWAISSLQSFHWIIIESITSDLNHWCCLVWIPVCDFVLQDTVLSWLGI